MQPDTPHPQMHPLRLDASVSKEFLLRFANALLTIDDLLGSLDNLPLLLKRIMMESARLVGAESSSLMLYDEETEELYFEVALGPRSDRVREIRLPILQGICGAAARERRVINVPDVRADPRWLRSVDQHTQYTTRNLVATPILHKDRLVGVIEVLNKQDGDAFTEADIVILEAVSIQAGIAIVNARLYEANLRAQRMATVGEAVAGMAHHIKNVLTGVKGCVSLIDVMLQEKRYDLLENSWELLKRNVGKVSDLTLDMLTYSKELHLLPAPTQLNQIAASVTEDLAVRAREMDVEIRAELDPTLPIIQADTRSIERCIMDLLSNALEAIAERRREEADAPGIVRVTTRACGANAVEIEVADTGCGIPPHVRDRVFTAFFTTKGSSGSGLGLAVTQKIVHQHGGTVTLLNNEPQGAIFRIRLPVRFAGNWTARVEAPMKTGTPT